MPRQNLFMFNVKNDLLLIKDIEKRIIVHLLMILLQSDTTKLQYTKIYSILCT